MFGVELHQTIYDPVRRAEALEAQAGAEILAGVSALSSSSTARAVVLAFVKFKADDWTIGVSVAVPLWTGGRLAQGQAAAARGGGRGEGEIPVADRRARPRAVEALRLERALADEGRDEADSVNAPRSRR